MIRTNGNPRLAPGADTSQHYTGKITALRGMKQRAKRLIVRATLWGLLPIPAAEWIIRHGGLRHE